MFAPERRALHGFRAGGAATLVRCLFAVKANQHDEREPAEKQAQNVIII